MGFFLQRTLALRLLFGIFSDPALEASFGDSFPEDFGLEACFGDFSPEGSGLEASFGETVWPLKGGIIATSGSCGGPRGTQSAWGHSR